MRAAHAGWLLGLAAAAAGGGGRTAAAAANEAPSVPAVHHVDDEEEVRLGRRLRCPVCQGMSIGDSPSPMAQDMMKQVRRMHAEGRSEDEIVRYFTERYGVWVLLDPPKFGFALWAWLLPPVGLAAGLAYVWQRARSGGPSPSAAAPPDAASPLDADDAALLAEARRHLEND